MASLGASARVPAADGVRGLAAVAIVLHHSAFVAGVSSRPGFWGAITSRLDVGVPVFFALSGFLLFRPMVARIVAGEALSSTPRFYRRRLIRIFPAYWVALVGQLLIGAISYMGLRGLAYHLTLTHVYTKGHAQTGLTQSWSLATELAFYAVLPLFAIWLARRCRGHSPQQRLLLSAVALGGWFAVSVGSRALNFALNGGWEFNWRFTVFANADFFAVGMLCAVIAVGRSFSPGFAVLSSLIVRRAWPWYALAAVAFVITATQLGLPHGLHDARAEEELARQMGYLLVAAGCIVPATLGDPAQRSFRWLSTRPLVFLGSVSYGLYLWHQIFLSGPDDKGLLAQWFGWRLFEEPLLPVFVLATLGSIVLGALSWYLVERPLLERFR